MNLINLSKRTDSEAKVAGRSQLYADPKEHGRSMVEMLGVLAIVGVLSVGAIAGYSKAMMKYKLNKHAEAVNMLINNMLQIKDKLERPAKNTTGSIYYNNLFYKMNLLPDGITYDNSYYLEDKYFNGKIVLYHLTSKTQSFGGIQFMFSPSAQGAEICKNIAFAAKENSANLWLLETAKTYNDDTHDYIGHLYGDAYCGGRSACLRDLDLNKVNNLCNVCDEKACSLYTLYL